MSQDRRRTRNLGAGLLEGVTQVLGAGQFCGGTRRTRSSTPRRKARIPATIGVPRALPQPPRVNYTPTSELTDTQTRLQERGPAPGEGT